MITADNVPSTGEDNPYCHIFFAMHDGSCIAFFDLGDGEAAAPSANTPGWVNHIALEVGEVMLGTNRNYFIAAVGLPDDPLFVVEASDIGG